MPTITDFPARGKVTRFENGFVTFIPANTSYELKLASDQYAGPLDSSIEAFIRVRARRLWTVPSGGNFVAPIFGPPRTIQGRVRYLDQHSMVVQAGVPIIVDLPTSDTAMDLNSGALADGTMVNVVAFPGASFTLAERAVAR